MAVQHAPNLVTSGQVMNLDPANPRSYNPNVFPSSTNIFTWFGPAGTNNCTLSRVAVPPAGVSPAGGIAMLMAVTGADPHIGSYNTTIWNIAPARPGETWTVSAWVSASVATDGEFLICGSDNTGSAFNPNTWIGGGTVAIGTTWTRVSITGTIPLSATAVVAIQLRLDGPTSASPAGINVYWDGVELERSNAASVFNPLQNVNGLTWSNLATPVNNGTLVNGPGFDPTTGGMIFTGTSSMQVNCGVPPVTGNAPWTWSAWIRPSASGTPFFMGTEGAGLGMISFWDSSTNLVRVGIFGTDVLTSTATIPVNTWGFTTWTWSGSVLTAYTNGVVSGTATGFSFNIGATATTIGGLPTISQFYSGQIGPICVYNRELSAQEINQNFQALRGRYSI
jgi:hypothetical protein